MARSRLADIIDQAVEGHPQFIRRRDGKEVVVVSRDYYDRTKGSLKSYLLEGGYEADGEDEFDAIMDGVRESVGESFGPRSTG